MTVSNSKARVCDCIYGDGACEKHEDRPQGLDEAVRMFAGYVRGENGFDELYFKEWLIEWREQEIGGVLDRLEAEMKRFTAEHDVPMRDETLSSIETERNKLRGETK